MSGQETNIVEKNIFGPALSIIVIFGVVTDTLYKFPNWLFFLILLIINCLNLASIKERLEALQLSRSIKEMLLLFLVLTLNLSLYYVTVETVLNLSYFFALITYTGLFTITLLIFDQSFKKITSINTNTKLIAFTLLIILLLLTASPVIDPINKSPKVKCFFYPQQFYFKETNNIQEGILYLKHIKGYAWNLNLTISDDDSFEVYLDHQIDGNKQIMFSKYGDFLQIPIQIYCPVQIEDGDYQITYELSYFDYLDIKNVDSYNLNIWVGEIPPAGFPWSFSIVAIVIVAVVAYIYLKTIKNTIFF